MVSDGKKGVPVTMTDWEMVTELSFRRSKSYLKDGKEVDFGANAQGWSTPREFRNLRWEGGVYNSDVSAPAAMKDSAPEDLNATIQQEIKKSIELEKRDSLKK
jgi:hypothetical protein